MIFTCYDILFQVSIVSKEMQLQTMNNTLATDLLKKCIKLASAYRNEGYAKAGNNPKELTKSLHVEPSRRKRTVRNKQFQYEAEDKSAYIPEIQFRRYFLYVNIYIIYI